MKRRKTNNFLDESWFSLFYDEQPQPREKTNVKKIDMIPTNVNQCKICFDGSFVYSKTVFYPGDIIEVCPTKSIDRTSLYSKDMRDIVFEIIPNEYFVIPFGYCQYYDIIRNNKMEPNCDYLWNPDNKTIIIRAIKRIEKMEKLILNIRK